MAFDQNTEQKLIQLRQKDKFSSSAWDSRGLIPSDYEKSEGMNTLINSCIDELLSNGSSSSDRQIRSILNKGLKRFNKREYDTEEREFICDCFAQIADITHVTINDKLNAWLYGSLLSGLMKLMHLLKPEKVIEVQKQPCTDCKTDLETPILKKEQDIPDHAWFIVRCDNCNGYNLLSWGENIKQTKRGNYEHVEQLPKQEYSEERAKARLEQIRYFRK